MAKKKNKKAHHTPRRRRMGAAGHHTDILNDAYQVGGVIVAAIAGTMIEGKTESINPKILSGVELVGGFMLKNHAKHPFMTGLGWGFIGMGAVHGAKEFGIIRGLDDLVSGVGDTHFIEEGQYGIRNNQHIAGIRNDQHVSGMEADMNENMADVFHAEGL